MYRSVHSGSTLRNLDILRALAVLAVFTDHLLDVRGLSSLGWISTSALGRAGVLAFFVHTSCVLGFSIDRLGLRGKHLLGSFLLRRVFRIYPLSILAIITVLLFKTPPGATESWVWVGWPSVLYSFLLIQNITHTAQILNPLWSLPYECQMCCLLPGIYAFVRHRSSRALLVLASASCLIFGLFWVKQNSSLLSTLRGLSTLDYIPCFLAGVWLSTRIQQMRRAVFTGYWWVLMVIVLMAGQCIAMHFLFVDRVANHETHTTIVEGWIFCLSLAFFYPWFRDSTFWGSNVARLIARYSYGIYLSHVPIFWLCFIELKRLPILVQYLLMIVLSTSIPVAIFHTLENPLIKTGRKLAERWFPVADPRTTSAQRQQAQQFSNLLIEDAVETQVDWPDEQMAPR